MCTLSYKDKSAKILREHAEKQAEMEAQCRISIEKDRRKNAESSALIAAKHEALLAATILAKREADEWSKLFFIYIFLLNNIKFLFLI